MATEQVSVISKLPQTGTSVFSVMSALAREHGAINLSQGFPDFEPDPALTDRVSWHLKNGGNQYSPSTGAASLRERIASLAGDFYGAKYDPESEITVTSGATEALFAAITAIVNPGDEVIVFEPAYDSYIPAIELNGGVPVFVPLQYPDYHIPWNQVKKLIRRKTRMILLNFPHNPTGAVLSEEDVAELTKIVKGTEIVILSDEVYEHIIFDGKRHESMARHPELARRSMVISSFGKSFHCTGWKVGYCMAPAYLTREFRKIHQFLTFSTSTPFQLALADFMENNEWFANLAGFYQEKRDYFLNQLKGSTFKPLKCGGTYFQLLSYQGLSKLGDFEFARKLTAENGIASIPVSVFYHERHDQQVLRFCFAKGEETLRKGAEILKSIK
ncbi:MAG: aminotransferase class I/II-fold pyridoxal phosphate-dependent enzyme [Bacteroidia bacterium]|nr:aminotransferase class I/II-fold pyridoxal phosphate-dependent enzyme [Bacteroidia bacterium]